MSDSALRSTKRELQRLTTSPRFWAAMGGATVLLGLTGPFGTYDGLQLPARLAYWGVTAVLTYLIGFGAVMLMVRHHRGEAMPGPLAFAIYGAMAGVPVTLVVWGLNALTFGGHATVDLLILGTSVVAIAAVVSALVALFTREFERSKATFGSVTQAAETRKRPKILDRLPAPQRGNLSHMSMQDHYVDVRTDRGGGLVLMRFADAIAEADGVEGVQIHRSHWVARDMVVESTRVQGRPMVRMKDGTLLPVSRGYQDAARAAGLI